MSRYRNDLPQLYDTFITDGGMETTLVFHDGIELPCFASFTLLRDEAGCEILRRYFRTYIDMALARRVGIVLESATWRANPDWAGRLGFAAEELAALNRKAIAELEALRNEHQTTDTAIVISGNLGPRGDGYVPDARMSAVQARDYHGAQIEVFADTAADMVAAFTMNYAEEAIGVLLAARDCAMPAAISFTVETDGCLPSGETLVDAIRRCDDASAGHAAYYMINCAHPEHFAHVLDQPLLAERLRGLRANASRRSHAELDEATELDIGDPLELGRQYRALRRSLPKLSVVGGCCGTDHRHIDAICSAFVAA
jgi:homocysteine S-methyltransferase